MKKIAILGAGIYQVPLIKKAKEMGLYTIVFSIKGNYPGFQYADKVYYVNTTDEDEIIKIAKQEGIDGICTTGTDVCVPTIGKVCDTLGLSGVSYDAAICAANKSDMKAKFIEQGVRTAKFKTVKNLEQVKEAIADMQLPIMVKAVDSSGSRGITKVKEATDENLSKAIESVNQVSKLDYFVVEECIEGVEFGAQALVYNGEVKFIMPHGDYVHMGDTGVPVGHYVPYNISDEILEESKKQVELSAKALGIDNCAINADFILRGEEVFVLEIGARAGATCLPEMVSIYYGVDFYKILLQVALGEEIESFTTDKLTPNVCKLLMADKTGEIENIQLPQVSSKNVIDVSCDYKVGDKVNKFKIGPDRIGQVIVKGDTIEAAVKEMDDLIEKIHIDVK